MNNLWGYIGLLWVCACVFVFVANHPAVFISAKPSQWHQSALHQFQRCHRCHSACHWPVNMNYAWWWLEKSRRHFRDIKSILYNRICDRSPDSVIATDHVVVVPQLIQSMCKLESNKEEEKLSQCSVVLVNYSLPLSSWDLSPRQYFFEDHSALNNFNQQTKHAHVPSGRKCFFKPVRNGGCWIKGRSPFVKKVICGMVMTMAIWVQCEMPYNDVNADEEEDSDIETQLQLKRYLVHTDFPAAK